MARMIRAGPGQHRQDTKSNRKGDGIIIDFILNRTSISRGAKECNVCSALQKRAPSLVDATPWVVMRFACFFGVVF